MIFIRILIFTIIIGYLYSETKKEFYENQFGDDVQEISNGGLNKFEDRKRSVLD